MEDRKDGKRKEAYGEITIESLKESPTYAEGLGIDLGLRNDKEIFKWFLASVLFGAPISETLAQKTYRSFERHGLLTPERILEAGWSFLVNPVMKEGGYVRYDEKTSREVLRNCEQLNADYGGSFNRLHRVAENGSDLESRLLAFYGVGPVTVNIFLRELRPYWNKADPAPLPVVTRLARQYGLDLNSLDRKDPSFVRIEAGLMRLRKSLQT